jgi:hypothetical protein
MAHLAPAPDFRFVGIEPGPSSRMARGIPLAVGVGTLVLGIVLAGFQPTTLPLQVLAALGAALIAQRAIGPVVSGSELNQVRMSIVPWGVLVHHDDTPRVVRWAGVRSIEVVLVHEMDNATPHIRWSVVKIRTDRELFGGRAHGGVALESLEANLERYADEASRPLAGDLAGQTVLDEWPDPTFESLLENARRLLAAGELGAELGLGPSSYRRADVEVCPETRAALQAVLSGSTDDSPADPRPLAAVLCAELGARELGAAVVPLTTSPNPMVAAIARAAALRLGVELRRAGALDELEEFVPSADLSQIRAWAGSMRAGS